MPKMTPEKVAATRTGIQLAGGIEKFLTAIAVPSGFTAEQYVEDYDINGMDKALRMTGDGITIRIVIHDADGRYTCGSGHVDFTTSRGSYTLDRRGVSDSFYVDREDTPSTVGAKLSERLSEVAATRKRHDESVQVPGLPGKWLVTDDQRKKITALLKDGRPYSFTPSGFGVGYLLSTRTGSRYDKRLPPETATFFGVDRLFYNTLDCD